jgi:hypothetical protein
LLHVPIRRAAKLDKIQMPLLEKIHKNSRGKNSGNTVHLLTIPSNLNAFVKFATTFSIVCQFRSKHHLLQFQCKLFVPFQMQTVRAIPITSLPQILPLCYCSLS